MTLKQINRAKSRAATITLDKEDEPLINTFISAKKLIAKTGERCKNIDRDIERVAGHIELFQEMIVELKEKKDQFNKDIELMSKYLSPSSVEEFKLLSNKIWRDECKAFDSTFLGKAINYFRTPSIGVNPFWTGGSRKDWDSQLNTLMDNFLFEEKNENVYYLGGEKLYVGSEAYSSFVLLDDPKPSSPYWMTLFRAAQKFERDTGRKFN